MMDYYSQFNMPTIEERQKNLLEYANTLDIVKVYDKILLNKIITEIVNKTPNLLLLDIPFLDNNQKKNNYMIYCIKATKLMKQYKLKII